MVPMSSAMAASTAWESSPDVVIPASYSPPAPSRTSYVVVVSSAAADVNTQKEDIIIKNVRTRMKDDDTIMVHDNDDNDELEH